MATVARHPGATSGRGAVLAAAVLTLAGVPFGLALTGGLVQPVMTVSLAGTLAVAALFLRRWPMTVLIFSVLAVAGMRLSELIDSGWAWPATAAFAALVLAGRLRVAIITAAITLSCGLVWDTFGDLDFGLNWPPTQVAGEALWIALVLAVAHAYRNTLRWRGEMAARLARDEHERELETQRRRAEERVGIARDLHDVIAHTLAVVGVHLNVALDAFDSDPAEAKGAVRLAQDVRGRAMTDLRALIDVLRDGAERPEPTGELPGLDRLAEQMRGAGLTVAVRETGDRDVVPAPVATAIFRVVQESLTNAVRHSGGSRVDVVLRYEPGEVTVEVLDDGAGGAPGTDGHGIAGMRERVAALGGALTAGPGPAGFLVRAVIPVTGPR